MWARIDNRKKNLLSSNISSTCPHNTVNFGPLAAKTDPVGAPQLISMGFASWQRYCMHARHSSIGRQPNSAALNIGRHLYSAGRPSRWALAHILVMTCCLKYGPDRFSSATWAYVNTAHIYTPNADIRQLSTLRSLPTTSLRINFLNFPLISSQVSSHYTHLTVGGVRSRITPM